LAVAVDNGAPEIPEIYDGEWPDEPTGEDNIYPVDCPDWLYYILELDDLHAPGMQDITTRRAPQGPRRRLRWFPPEQLYIETVPVRELDDPPDGDGDSSSGELIVELNNINIEGKVSE
jgi:hypothetical protein